MSSRYPAGNPCVWWPSFSGRSFRVYSKYQPRWQSRETGILRIGPGFYVRFERIFNKMGKNCGRQIGMIHVMIYGIKLCSFLELSIKYER